MTAAETPEGRPAVDHAEAVRRLVHVIRAARLGGNDRVAQRASRRLQRHLDAHLEQVRRDRLS